MQLKVSAKNVYGVTLIYPECDTSKTIAEWLKQKTFPKRDLEFMQKLGYKLEIITPQFEGIA